MATPVPSRSARRIGLLVGGGKSGALTDADLRGCRWIEGEPKPLRRGMFCGRRVPAGESWCAMHRGIVFGEERRRCCVKKVRERHAVREMKEDPSEPSCRGRLQTAMSCFGQKLR